MAQVGFEKEGLYGSAYLFNGDQDDGSDEINDLGLNLGYAWEGDDFSGDVGVSYLSNLAGSDGVSGHLDDNVGLGGAISDDIGEREGRPFGLCPAGSTSALHPLRRARHYGQEGRYEARGQEARSHSLRAAPCCRAFWAQRERE